MVVLVTGASGYVGARLIPELLKAGHEVRAGFTDPDKASRFPWADQVMAVELDVLDASLVQQAVDGVDAVYYLVHAMDSGDFATEDRDSATNVAEAAKQAGVERIIYLSGLVPDVAEDELSEHIASRLEVERTLASTGVPTLTLRAAVITGSGSTSFEIIRQISERMPVQTIPDWMDSTVQPIAVVDVVAALVGALRAPAETRSYDVGGPDALPYAQLLDVYAEVADLERPQTIIPGLPSDMVGMLAGLITDVPSDTVEALVESLKHDMVCQEDDFTRDLLPDGYELVDLRSSFERSLAAPDAEHSDPMAARDHDPKWAGGTGGGAAGVVAGIKAVATSIKEKLTGRD